MPQLALDEESEHSDGLGDEELHVNDLIIKLQTAEKSNIISMNWAIYWKTQYDYLLMNKNNVLIQENKKRKC